MGFEVVKCTNSNTTRYVLHRIVKELELVTGGEHLFSWARRTVRIHPSGAKSGRAVQGQTQSVIKIVYLNKNFQRLQDLL